MKKDKMNKQHEIRVTKTQSNTARRIVSTIFGVVEIILAFRLIFKLLGANHNNWFVQGIYRVAQYIVSLFDSIFSRFASKGVETTSIFEPVTLISMLVLALIARAIIKLMAPRTGTQIQRTETTGHDVQIKIKFLGTGKKYFKKG